MARPHETSEIRRTIDAVWRIEAAKVIATLARMVGDLSAAEDLAQDALLEALAKWPEQGIPRNPAAWLTAVGKRRAIDGWRRSQKLGEKYALIATTTEPAPAPDDVERLDEPQIDDDLLRLIFICCHPVLAPTSRAALALRILCGLSTDEIARAYLVPSATMGQRITRAKRTLTAANVPFELPARVEFASRLGDVYEVIYLVFNEGYSATAGDDWMRPELCELAIRLGRVLATLVPDQSEAHGLVALMELHASRVGARSKANGEPILLLEQNRSRWDRLLIAHGLEQLRKADALERPRGNYTLQAAIAACHARAATPEQTDWAEIAALYEALARLTESPVVELNRAVAISMAYGPEAGLEIVEALTASGRLDGYHLLPSVRGDLLEKLGRRLEARTEFLRAAELTRNERERTVLLRRAADAVE
ncbi:MAG TPA: RNA polymerase sigma factor [Humibacter sp.]|nr:RNA polymerase sigma factor [Humibacter sp.]